MKTIYGKRLGNWYLGKEGISFNDGGKFLTFSFRRLHGLNPSKAKKWYLHFFLYIYGFNKKIIIDRYFFKITKRDIKRCEKKQMQ